MGNEGTSGPNTYAGDAVGRGRKESRRAGAWSRGDGNIARRPSHWLQDSERLYRRQSGQRGIRYGAPRHAAGLKNFGLRISEFGLKNAK
jgi:hypothetical protein